jgi:hypothetical protein
LVCPRVYQNYNRLKVIVNSKLEVEDIKKGRFLRGLGDFEMKYNYLSHPKFGHP